MGYLKVADLARLSQQLGTPLVLMVNVFTGGYNDLQGDTDALAEGAAVAGAYAAMTIERGYDVALWEVGSETFNWANSNHDPKIFDGGYGYVEATKLYFDAITQAYVDAELVPPPINISVSDGGETSWQREFDGMDLEDGTFDAGDALGVAGYGSIFDPVAEHEKYWTGWSHHWYPGVLTYLDGDKVINHDCPAESARYWELLQADVNHRLVNTATQSVDEYFLPLSGMDGLEDEALPGLKAAITEYNMRFPTDQADSAYSAVHAVESAMRWSSHARVDKVTYYALTAKGLGMVSNHRSNVSHQGNINRVLDTQDLDFDLFWHMPGLAMSLLGRAINTADVRLETTLEGGLTTNPGGGSGGQSGGHGGGPTVGEVCPRAIRSCRLSHRLTGRSAQGLSQTWAAPA
jgi:hypothetical protein